MQDCFGLLVPRELGLGKPRFQTYLEVDLPRLLARLAADEGELGYLPSGPAFDDFRRFFLLFGRDGVTGTAGRRPLLTRAVQGSSGYSIGVGEELKDRVFEALRLTVEGFVSHPANELDAEADRKGDRRRRSNAPPRGARDSGAILRPPRPRAKGARSRDEREVISERVRDKIAASRKKGMWMGGSLPLGYDLVERKLVANQTEAATVRHIMKRYVELGCGRLLLEDLRANGIITKQSHQRGGIPFGRGSLFYLLNNRAYRGEVRHRDAFYPGDHQPIVDEELWEAVQATLSAQRTSETRRANSASVSLLAGVLYDKLGRNMVPSHASKSGRRYRYYVTEADAVSDTAPAARLPAHDIEEVVRGRLVAFLTNKSELRRELMITDAGELSSAAASATSLAGSLKVRRELPLKLLSRVELSDAAVLLTINREALSGLMLIDSPPHAAPITLAATAVRVRHGKEVRMVLSDSSVGEDESRTLTWSRCSQKPQRRRSWWMARLA